MAESLNPIASPTRPFRRPGKRVVLAILIVTLFLTLLGAITLGYAFSPGGSHTQQALLLALAATCLALPARVAWVHLRRKWKTGHWLITDDERLSLRAKWATQKPSSRRWMQWLDVIGAIINTAAAAVMLRNAIRASASPGRHIFDWSMAILWTLLAAQSIWTLFRKIRKTPSANQPLAPQT